MKIRTDFVTNSSSSSFVSVHIENEKLMKIFSRHNNLLECCEKIVSIEKKAGGTFVLDYENDEDGDTPPPTTKDSFVESLIQFLDIDCFLQSCNADNLYEDLRKNKDEIVMGLKSVRWEYCHRGWGDSEDRINRNYSEADIRKCLQLDDHEKITDVLKDDFDKFVRLSSSEDDRSYSFDGETEEYKESYRLEYDFQRTVELTEVHSIVSDGCVVSLVTIAKIRLSATSRGKIYDFLCDVENIEAGDSVLLEGYGDQPYTVLSVERIRVEDLKLPFNSYKKVISKL